MLQRLLAVAVLIGLTSTLALAADKPKEQAQEQPASRSLEKPPPNPADQVVTRSLEEAQPWVPERPWEVIDLAIALDTSGSMTPLIEAARLKLWEIVNELTLMRPTPTLRVALITYGNSKNDPKAGWVRVETDLTENLDLVSERLFELTSEGGQEYVGRVLQVAFEGLSWTPSEEALKMIFVAGNEKADQDPEVRLDDMSDIARREGIFVNAVYCGNAQAEDAESWQELAELAEGQFATIRHGGRPAVETPYDEELARLSETINTTYIPLGEEGRKRQETQAAQDKNAKKLSTSAAASRAQTKTSRTYSAAWDLVDAVETEKVDLYEMDESELPEKLQKMSLDEREIYLQDMQVRRDELREQIRELSAQRKQYIAQQIEEQGLDTSQEFDVVILKAVQSKAEDKGFQKPEDPED
jgi:hypothetical protein